MQNSLFDSSHKENLMTKSHWDKRIVLASNNQGKVEEINQLLANRPVEVVLQQMLGISEVEETGLTFVENAILKARHAAGQSGLPAIADDSGIEVDALMGAPGIYSARFAGPVCSDQQNNIKLIQALSDLPQEQRTARYQCVLVYMRHAQDPTPVICQGTWEGVILESPRGNNGFGYDPLFYLPDRGLSAAEMSTEEKNRISHRGQALQKLLNVLPI